MSATTDAANMLGPASDLTNSASHHRAPDRLSGTTGEDSNSVALRVGAMATFKNGASSIRFTLRKLTGAADQVAATDILLEANGRFDWTVENHTKVIYIQAGDGSTAYEGWVWQSSPGR